ncbi:hypothetical protein [Streptomyces sp. NPDC059564]|uniref:hypothetical protein n=1 Tax=Streptomyces sp. NPDC059564 TaxID=3346865 RepID=UPI0036CC72E4
MASAAGGCTPAPKALLAVERTDAGRARVLIAPCPEYDALQFSVSSSGGSVGHQRWALINDAMGGPLASVDLFSPPQGWSVTRSALSDLKGGREYTVKIDGAVRGRGLDGRLSFTPSQFDSLKPGRVIVTNGEDSKVIEKSEFMKKDAGRCA